MLKLLLFLALLGVSSAVTYTITTITGFREHEGTGGDISVSLKAGSKSVDLGKLPKSGAFEKGALDTFTISSHVDIDTANEVCATFTASGGDAWKVNSATVTSSSMTLTWHLYNEDDQYLSTDAGEGGPTLTMCSQGLATYQVQFKTSDAKYAGSDNIHAKISLYKRKDAQDSKSTSSSFLDNRDLDDFEQGAVDTFTLKNMRNFFKIRCVRMTADSDDAWLIEQITVKKTFPHPKAGDTAPTYTFTNTKKHWLSSDTGEGMDDYLICN